MEVGVHIDFTKCTFCLDCADCRHGAIKINSDGELIIDNTLCTLDASCLPVCTENALYLILANGEIEQ